MSPAHTIKCHNFPINTAFTSSSSNSREHSPHNPLRICKFGNFKQLSSIFYSLGFTMSDGDVVLQLTHTNFGDYDENVMTEILERLPIKSLMRFRCVCKSWLALISDSHFAKKRLSYAERGVTYKLNFMIAKKPLFLDLEALLNLNAVDDVQFAVTVVGFPVLDSNLDSGFRVVVGACT